MYINLAALGYMIKEAYGSGYMKPGDVNFTVNEEAAKALEYERTRPRTARETMIASRPPKTPTIYERYLAEQAQRIPSPSLFEQRQMSAPTKVMNGAPMSNAEVRQFNIDSQDKIQTIANSPNERSPNVLRRVNGAKDLRFDKLKELVDGEKARQIKIDQDMAAPAPAAQKTVAPVPRPKMPILDPAFSRKLKIGGGVLGALGGAAALAYGAA